MSRLKAIINELKVEKPIVAVKLETELENLHKELKDAREGQSSDEQAVQLERLHAELQKYKAAEVSLAREEWAGYEKLLTVDESDPRHAKISKIKDDFAIGDSLSPTAIKANLEAIKPYVKIGFFEMPKPKKYNSKMSIGGLQTPVSTIKREEAYII